MAYYDQVGNFKQTLTCPLCKCLFQDPVTLDCGHNFCQGCIKVCDMEREPRCCPECGEESAARVYVPNKALVKSVDKIKEIEQVRCASNCSTANVFGTCCVSSCSRQSIDVHMQMCLRHWALLVTAMEESFYSDKGYREAVPVTRDPEGGGKDPVQPVQTPVSVASTEKNRYYQDPAQERAGAPFRSRVFTLDRQSETSSLLSASTESLSSIDRPVSFKNGITPKVPSISGDSAIGISTNDWEERCSAISAASLEAQLGPDGTEMQYFATAERCRSLSCNYPTRLHWRLAEQKSEQHSNETAI